MDYMICLNDRRVIDYFFFTCEVGFKFKLCIKLFKAILSVQPIFLPNQIVVLFENLNF